jgi:acyl dehydratase
MNIDALRKHEFAPQRTTYAAKDAILYALSVGAGADPVDAHQLPLVYEPDLRVLPTMAAVLAHPGAWIAHPNFEVNYLKLLHGEQGLTMHAPLPPGGDIEATYRIQAVVDKGDGKGALVYFEKQLRSAGGQPLCTVYSALFLRADGGGGSFGTPPAGLPMDAAPAPEFFDELRTPLNAALLYRLNGDLNPIHADPVAARKAGFERPILHGLCTYGVVGYLLTRTVCGHDPARLLSLGARFTSPVYPGETIRVEGTRNGDSVRFQATVPERNQIVLSQGYARIG